MQGQIYSGAFLLQPLELVSCYLELFKHVGTV
jgi:hypothetical protein